VAAREVSSDEGGAPGPPVRAGRGGLADTPACAVGGPVGHVILVGLLAGAAAVVLVSVVVLLQDYVVAVPDGLRRNLAGGLDADFRGPALLGVGIDFRLDRAENRDLHLAADGDRPSDFCRPGLLGSELEVNGLVRCV